MNVSKDTFSTLCWILVIVVVAILTAVVLGPLYRTKKEKFTQLEQRRGVLALKEKKRDLLREQVDDLKNDPEAVERKAKEKFGMARPGEKVLRIKK